MLAKMCLPVVAILPPDNYAATLTDEESGDEEDTSMDHLPGSTLGAEVVDSCSEPSDDEDEEEPPAKLQKRHVKWHKRDLCSSFLVGDLCEPDSAEETPLTPAEAFEKFFDVTVINQLVENTNTYAQQKNRLLNVHAASEPEEKETAKADTSQENSTEDAQSQVVDMSTQAARRRDMPALGMTRGINTSSAVKRSLE
ncbi:hypothetical protein MRX96_002037 [Rhipicephalus microplus]